MMDFLRIASFVPIAGCLLHICEKGPEFLQTIPLLFTHITHGYLISIFSKVRIVWNDPNLLFLWILALRYYRLIGHIVAYLCLYKPEAIPSNPTVTAQHAHVVVPTIDPDNPAFEKCLLSILKHSPKRLTIVTGGPEYQPRAAEIAASLQSSTSTSINVSSTQLPNKRRQMAVVLDELASNREENKNTIVIFVDDHAWWVGESFLPHLLAPFENPNVGLVGTKKRVERNYGSSLWQSFINFLGCVYLERHNFELTATNALDGVVFVISARTCALRANIAMKDEFRSEFVNERFFFKKFGPLNSDDDNYITRYVVRDGWDIKFQNDVESENIMYTTLGIDGFSKFHGQLVRWARSQWRSNFASLLTERSVWRRQWWTTHAAFLTSFVNVAIFWDTLILWTWHKSTWTHYQWYYVLSFILLSKAIKLMAHFARHPADMIFFPAYVIFAYCHAYYKIMALFSFHDITWSGRQLRASENVQDADAPGGYESDYGSDDDDSDSDYDDNFGPGHSRSQSTGPSVSRSSKETGLPSSNNKTLGLSGESSSLPKHLNLNLQTLDEVHECVVPELASDARYHSFSSSSSNSFSEQYGKRPQHTGTANRFTPWGSINTNCPHLLPANVNESQYNLRSRVSKGPRSSSGSNAGFSLRQRNSGRSSDPQITLKDNSHGANVQTSNIDDPTIARLGSVDVGEDHFGKPILSLALPPPGPCPLDPLLANSSCHYQPELACKIKREGDSISCTKSSTLMPPGPKSDLEIHFKQGISICDRQVNKFDYRRSFTRGDDCHRMHGDGTCLSLPKGHAYGKRLCLSSGPRYPVLRGQPRW